jgi:hypothetical protein
MIPMFGRGSPKGPDGNFQENLLCNAEQLQKYAWATGVDVDPDVHDAILKARKSRETQWQDDGWKDLYSLYPSLSKKFIPVTPETLRAGTQSAKWTIQKYKLVVGILGVILIASSILLFINSKMSEIINAQIVENNALAVTLATAAANNPTRSSNPSGVPEPERAPQLSQLQTFAQATKSIYTRAQQLNYIIWPDKARESDPNFELKNFEVDPKIHPLDQVNDKINLYQQVRSFAVSVRDTNTIIYGAITAYLLPILYALLGALAYLVRDFSKRTLERTFQPSFTTPTYIAAGIGGGMVGFFTDFTTGASFSPLAIAFLVGFHAEAFYVFLETLARVFKNPSQTASPQVVVVEDRGLPLSRPSSPGSIRTPAPSDNSSGVGRQNSNEQSQSKPNGPDTTATSSVEPAQHK